MSTPSPKNTGGYVPSAAAMSLSTYDNTPPAATGPGYGKSPENAVPPPGHAAATSSTYVPSAAAMSWQPPAVVGVSSNRPIPPNAPPGGQWVRVKYNGCITWTCFFLHCLWVCEGYLDCCCCCDGGCDEKEAYKSPSGVLYDEKGHAMSDSCLTNYTVID